MYKLGLYQDDQGVGGINYGMAGNIFTGNTVTSSSTSTPNALWDFLDQSSGGISKPSDYSNTYCTPRPELPSLGDIIDVSPILQP